MELLLRMKDRSRGVIDDLLFCIVTKLQKYQEEIRLQREEALKKKEEQKLKKEREELEEKQRIEEELRQLDLLYKMEKGEIKEDYSQVYKVYSFQTNFYIES